MKRFLTLALTCLPFVCFGATTYTTYFNNTHTYTNATVAGAVRVGSLVSTNGITGQDLTADRAAFTDSNKKLVSTGTSAALSGALSDETGSGGVAVFASNPSLAGLTSSAEIVSTLGSISADASALDATATWNNAGVTFTGLKMNITDTASAAASMLMELQVGSASRFRVNKTGTTLASGASASGAGHYMLIDGDSVTRAMIGMASDNTPTIQFGSGSATRDTILLRDAANTLAMRNGANAQAFNVYNTYTDASNYERAVFDWKTTANTLRIGTDKAGTGVNRGISFVLGGTAVWSIGSSTGHLLANTDNTYDIGAAAATRPRFVHVARTTVSGVTSPAQITADQNNYNPGAQGKFIRLSTDASRTLTGLTFTTAQVDGEEHLIVNVGAQDLVLAHESGSSTAGNRFLSTTGASLTLTANQQAALWYDGTTARWRVSKNN